MQWIQDILTGTDIGFAFFAAVFLLGILGALSSCCTLPVLGAVIGYAGSRTAKQNRRELLLVGLFFMLGTTVSLAIIGLVSGLLGQMANAALGRYWQFASGLLIVFIGLISLNLVRIPLPKINVNRRILGQGMISVMIYGLILGGASTACSLGCNPLLPAAIGAAVIHGTTIMGSLTLIVFALGYSLPLSAGLVGISFGLGRLHSVTQRTVTMIQYAAGALLIVVGFYLLATI